MGCRDTIGQEPPQGGTEIKEGEAMQENTAPESRFAGFLHWLENVFWYHYKWYYFAGVFAAVLLIAGLVTFLGRKDYDWRVQYVHAGEADPAAAARLTELFTAAATDESGNGRVEVLVEETGETADPGRRDILGLLRDPENMLFVLDGETLALYQGLGYFAGAVPLPGGLWAGIHDAPVIPYTLEEYAPYGYDQAGIDEANAWQAEEHARLLGVSEDILRGLGS